MDWHPDCARLEKCRSTSTIRARREWISSMQKSLAHRVWKDVEGGTVEAFEAVALSCCFQSFLWLQAARYFLIFLTLVSCFRPAFAMTWNAVWHLSLQGRAWQIALLMVAVVSMSRIPGFVLRNLGNYFIHRYSYCNRFMAEHNYPNLFTTRTT